jgi:hypothetical protein
MAGPDRLTDEEILDLDNTSLSEEGQTADL